MLIQAGWNATLYLILSFTTPVYTKEITFTANETVSTGPFNCIDLHTAILTQAVVNPAYPGSPGNDAYAFIDPMIQIDPLTPNALDY